MGYWVNGGLWRSVVILVRTVVLVSELSVGFIPCFTAEKNLGRWLYVATIRKGDVNEEQKGYEKVEPDYMSVGVVSEPDEDLP